MLSPDSAARMLRGKQRIWSWRIWTPPAGIYSMSRSSRLCPSIISVTSLYPWSRKTEHRLDSGCILFIYLPGISSSSKSDQNQIYALLEYLNLYNSTIHASAVRFLAWFQDRVRLLWPPSLASIRHFRPKGIETNSISEVKVVQH